MRDNNFKQLIREFDLIIFDDMFGSEIETDEDYSELSIYFDEDE